MKKILVVGVGSIGERHLRCFLATRRVRCGICEPRPEIRSRMEEEYSVTESFANLDSALEKAWDAVVIATPAHTHIPIALRAAGNGIPLLIEKPLSVSMEGIEDLLEELRSRSLLGAVAYVYRAHPGVRWLKEVVDDGRFGSLKQLSILSGQNFPFYRPAYREIYYADRAQGGGAIQDCFTHLLNLAEYLAGPVTRITADFAHQVLEGVEVEDTVHAIARHGETMASYCLNQYQAPNETQITLVFEKGTARFDLHENRCRWMTEPESEWTQVPLPSLDRDGWFIRQEEAFLDSLEGVSPPLCTVEEARETLETTLAILQKDRNSF